MVVNRVDEGDPGEEVSLADPSTPAGGGPAGAMAAFGWGLAIRWTRG